MEEKTKYESILNAVPLQNAVLCADCEVISDSAGDACSVCGSHSLISLGRVLGGSVGDERAVLVNQPEPNLRSQFTLLIHRDASTTLRPSRRWLRPLKVAKSGT